MKFVFAFAFLMLASHSDGAIDLARQRTAVIMVQDPAKDKAENKTNPPDTNKTAPASTETKADAPEEAANTTEAPNNTVKKDNASKEAEKKAVSAEKVEKKAEMPESSKVEAEKAKKDVEVAENTHEKDEEPSKKHGDVEHEKLLPIGEGAYQSAEAVKQRTTDYRRDCEKGDWKNCFKTGGDNIDGHSYGNLRHEPPKSSAATAQLCSVIAATVLLVL